MSISGARSAGRTWTSNGSVSESWTFYDVDSDLRISASTEGMASLRLNRVTIWQDTDGDGFTDKREADTGFSSWEVGYFETDPLVADTEGDGLDEDDEIDGKTYRSYGEAWDVFSHPRRIHSDEDGLDDAAERAFDAEPLDPDTDGDGLDDFEDPRIRTESIPPSIDVTFKEGLLGGNIVTVGAEDESGLQELTAVYEIDYGTGEITYIDSNIQSTDHEMPAGMPAEANTLIVTATDENDNVYRIEIEIEEDGSGELVSSGVHLAGITAISRVSVAQAVAGGVSVTSATLIGAGIVVVGGTALVGYHVYETMQDEGTTTTYEVPNYPSPVETEYSAGDVTLREGFVDTAGGYARGYGWEYISATSAVTQEDIGEIFQNAEEEGILAGGTTIGTSDGDLIATEIVGSALTSAADFDRGVEHDTAESNCETEDFVVETENERGEEGNPEHTLRDEKPVNDIDELDETIQRPDRILDFDGRRHLFRTLDNGKTMVVKLHRNLNYENVYELITQLTDDGELYDSVEDAVDDIKNREGGEPTNDVSC